MRGGLIPRISGRAAVCAALAALVFFSRAWLVRAWGSPLPFWDQWDAEAISLYLPWGKGTLHWQDLFRAHNEHRILLTRLADLALFIVCGGWNPWAQMLLNAALHAATAAALAAIFWPALPPRSRVLFVVGLALLFSATCGWQNALFGFQSGVYFANLLAVGAIAGLGMGTPLRAGWWLGLVAAVLAFFSNGGGLLAGVAAFIVGLGFAWGTPRTARAWVALGLITTVAVIAVLLSPNAPQHAPFHARTASQFFAVLMHCLAWPWINLPLYCLLMQLPLAWLVIDRWRRREPLDAAERCALALGLFALLQAAAIAYSRGAVLPESRPLSRYQDPLLLGVAGQLFAGLRIFASHGRAGRVTGLVWCGMAIGGLISLTETNFTLHLPFKRTQDRANLAIVRAYASTGDASVFTRDPNFSGPHPDPRVVQRVIDDPDLRATLPAAVLAPEGSPAAELPWVIRHSPALTAVSVALLLGLLTFLFRAKSDRSHPAVPAQTRARP
jgi:hypothetical protein